MSIFNVFKKKPKKDPQELIKQALIKGEKLTVQKCFSKYHTTEARKIFSRLRASGWNILSKKVAHDDYHEYWLSSEELAA